MPEPLVVLLDQNVPRGVKGWLKTIRPDSIVYHTSDVGLDHKADEEIFHWAQRHHALIVTFDEDFADNRLLSAMPHHGIIRLRVWPTTLDETIGALGRLFAEVREHELKGTLVIVDQTKIRVRPPQ